MHDAVPPAEPGADPKTAAVPAASTPGTSDVAAAPNAAGEDATAGAPGVGQSTATQQATAGAEGAEKPRQPADQGLRRQLTVVLCK